MHNTTENESSPPKVVLEKRESRNRSRRRLETASIPDRPAELYNIRNDVAETKDLADVHPEIVRELYKKLSIGS